jgi:hypothetical protein
MDNTGTARGMEPTIHTVIITITVGPDGKIASVEPESPGISKNGQEQVIWKTVNGEDFVIDFKGDSPFYESQFDKRDSVSGLVRRGVLTDIPREFKYCVRTENDRTDPGIIVNR